MVSHFVTQSNLRSVVSIRLLLAACLLCGVQLAARASETHEADLAAFFKEADATYPFFDLKGIRGDWAAAKPRLAEKAKTCTSDTEFLGIVIEAIRCLRDAHMGLSNTKAPLPKLPPQYYPGLSFMPATENRVVIMWAADAHTAKLKPGTVVTKIDGQPARAFLEAKAKAAWSCEGPHFVSSPQRARLFTYRMPLTGRRGETHTLHYLAQGQEQELRVTCDLEARGWPHQYNMPTNLTRQSRAVAYCKLPSGAGYMYLRYVRAETEPGIRQAVAAHPDAKGWILDLRGNGGGGYDDTLIERLKTLPRPVAVLLDAGCISAGETLARDLARHANARLLGARTAGSSSSKRQWTFPSGIASVTFSTRSRWGKDSQPIEFNGIAPDVELEAVPEEVAQGLNSEIRRAEEYLADVVSRHPELMRQNQAAAARLKTSRPVITGCVTDAAGKPIGGARLLARTWRGSGDRRDAEVVSGDDGRFRLEDLGPNTEYRVFVQAEEHAAAWRQQTTGAGGTNECNFRLAKGIRVSGRVADTANHPLPGACLELVPIKGSGEQGGGFLAFGFGEAKTDQAGRFAVSNAAPGRYWVKIYQPSQGGDRCWQQMALSPKLVLIAGMPCEDLDVRVLPPEAYTISGLVVDGEGKPRAGVPVGTYIPHDRAWWNRTDPQGRFVLRSLNGIGRDPLDVNVDFDDCKVLFRNVPIGTRDLKCIKHQTGEIAGVLLDERGEHPLTNYEVKVERVHLLDCAGLALGPRVSVTRPGPPGAFQITRVPPGRAILEFKVGARRQWSAVQVGPGQSVRDQRITLQPPCIFEGTALFTSAPGQKQNVGLEVVQLETGQGMPWIDSDKSGAFRCDTLPAGEYAVRALYGGEVYQTKNVRLDHGKTTTEHFTVGGTATIKGAIQFPEEDCGYVHILLRETGFGFAPNVWAGRPPVTDHVLSWTLAKKPGGQYEIRHVPAGTWEVVAFAPASERCLPFHSLPRDAQPVTIAEGETKNLDLELTASSSRSTGP
jgi:C-terminal processing protease CtpA/Prc